VGKVHMVGPADPEGKCPYCLMEAKQLQFTMYQEEMTAAVKKPGDETTWIPWPPGLDKEIQDGRYIAVAGQAPHLGLAPGLCWDHVAGIKQQTPSGLVVADGMPPGLVRGGR
jgi:hypothetical protein